MISRDEVKGVFAASEVEDIGQLIHEFLEDECDNYHWFDKILWESEEEWRAFNRRYDRLAKLYYVITAEDMICQHGTRMTQDGKPIAET